MYDYWDCYFNFEVDLIHYRHNYVFIICRIKGQTECSVDILSVLKLYEISTQYGYVIVASKYFLHHGFI